LLVLTSCSPEPAAAGEDSRAVVFGPSLAEMFHEGGAWSRVAAVDAYTNWPAGVESLPRVGGYLDPSPEAIAALGATSIHSVGWNLRLSELAAQLGIPYHSYSFDTLEDVFAACDSLENRYPEVSFTAFRNRLDRVFRDHRGQSGGSAALVVFHGHDGRFTLAGKGTFYQGLLEGIGCSIAAPETGTYPDVSVEGILHLNPDALVFLAPDQEYPDELLARQRAFWEARGFPPERVFVLSDDFMLIPGARLPDIGERLALCLSFH